MKSSKSRPLFSRASLMVAAALLAVAAPKPAKAANLTWSQANTNTYSWINAANWSGGTGYPDDLGDVANLNVNILGANTITLDTNVTLGALNIGDATGADAFIIQAGVVAQPGILPLAGQSVNVGAGSIVMDALGVAPVSITKTGAGVTDEIAALIYFNDALTITASTGKIRLSGGLRSGQSQIDITGAGEVEISAGGFITGGNVVKSGTGILRLGTGSAYSGETIINEGSLILSAANVVPDRSRLTVGATATFNLNNNAETIGSLSGSGLVTNTGGSAQTLTIGRDDLSSTFTGRFTATTAANLVLTKIGDGVFTFAPSAPSTYTGATNVQGGEFRLDFVNSGTNASLMAASPLTLQSGGLFTLVGRAGFAASQTLGAFTAGTGGGVLSVVAGDTNLTTLTLGALAFGASTNASTLLVSAPANTRITTTTARPAENIYGNGRAVFTDGTNFDWLSTASSATPYILGGMGTAAGAAYTGSFPAVGGTTVATGNYTLSGGQTQTTAASNVFTLKISSTGASQSLALGAFDLGFGSNGGGLLVTGTNAYTISGTGGLRVGTNSSGDLVIHQYNTGGLTISAPIKDQTASTGVTHLVKAGTGELILTGDNTFTGTITVAAGTLTFSNTGTSGTGTLGRGIATAVRLADGATLRYAGPTGGTLANATTANSHGIALLGGVAFVNIPAASNNVTFASVFSGAGGLTKNGAGNLTITGANTFTGPLTIAAGRLISSGADRIADTVPVIVQSGAFWELTGGGDAIGSLAGDGTIVWNDGSQRTLNVGGDNTNTTFSGRITNSGSRTDHNFSKRGSGVLTVNMSATVALSGGNTYIDAGVIRVATGAGQQFPANATYTINNAAQSAIFDLNGSSQRTGTLNFYNSNSTIASQGLILLGNGGTLTIGGDINVNSFNGNPQAAGIIGGAGSTLSLGNALRTINVRKSLSLAPDEADFVIDAAIDGGGTAGAWLKTGGGTLRIQGQSLLNGTLATRFDAGLTLLDYATASSTLVANRLNPAGGIDLRGGSVRFLGNPNFDVSQTVAGLVLPAVATGNTGGYSSIDLFAAGGRKLVLNLGAISQRVAGTVRFTLPAGVQDAANGITTTTSNDLFTGLLGTLGAAATVTDGSGATSFATRVGSNIVPVTMASRDALAGVTNGENITDVAGYSGSLLNVVSPISVRFNATGSSLLSIPDGGVLKVISGGILQTAAAGSATLAVTGANAAAGSLAVTVASTAGLIPGMPVAVTGQPAGTGLPAGARITQIVDATTFLIDRPVVSALSGAALTAGSVTVIQGGILRSPTRELIIGNDTTGWNPSVFGDPDALYPTKRLVITSSIDGQQGITKTGNGTLVLRAGAQANDFSGIVQIQGGVLELARSGRGSFAIGDSAPVVFSNQDSSNLRMVMDGVSLSGVAGATAIGSTVVKLDSTLGLSVGQVISGNGINPGTRVASLNFTASYVAIPSASIANAATTNASTTVNLASTAGLVVGQPITGPGIPAGAYIAAITPDTSITLSVAANATAPSVSLTAAAVTEVTTAGRHGVVNSESLTISGAPDAGFNGVFSAIIDPLVDNRFVLTGTPNVPSGAPQTFVIDAGRRFVMSAPAFSTATGPTVVQAASQYGETIGAISGGNRATNSQYTFIDLGLGTTLTVNQTQDSTFNGELMGLGALRVIGNGTLTLGNLSRNHGSLIIDSGT
ncbi:MAG: hypothetical protein FJ384_09195, partial [Verrucomicrobia bacterium]|nr:hypothetical protein [Verrucomicrobiota bacterium]